MTRLSRGAERARTRTLALAMTLGVFLCAPAGAQDWFVFPNEGQSQDEQDKAEFQCIRDARERTGFDPMATPQATQPAPQQRGGALGGAARGALLGTAVGAIGGNVGRGAAMGAAGGGLLGGMRRNDSRREQEQWARDQTANYQQDRDRFTRAFTACMEARGFTVR